MPFAAAHERFVALVARPAETVPLLTAAAALGAAVVTPSDIDHTVARAVALASDLSPSNDRFGALAARLFVTEGFRGDDADYGAPRNSDLHAVLDRRRGLPIALSVLMIGAGEAAGVPVVGIGLPAHFIVRDGTDPERFCDPFHGGEILDVAGVRARLHERLGAHFQWSERFLDPVLSHAILARMARNLMQAGVRRDDHPLAVRAARALLAVPGVDRDETRRVQVYLGSVARVN